MALVLAHLSDSHFNQSGRLRDVVDAHRAILQTARERGVNLFLHAGDFFERRSTAAERTALAEFLQAAAEIAPVCGAKGNHDQAGDLEIFNRLETKHPIYIEERVTRFGEAQVFDVGLGRRLAFIGLAWIDKAHLMATLDAALTGEQTTAMTIGEIRGLLAMLRAEAARLSAAGAVPVMATHVMLGGSVVSSGQILIGQGVELSPSDLLEIGCAYVACGHVHVEQSWFDGRVAYSGSPARCNFGERESKGFRLVTLSDAGEFLSNEFIELQARPMEFIDFDFTRGRALADLRQAGGFPGNFVLEPSHGLKGALVRLRYRINAEDLHLVDAARAEAALQRAGAAEVKVEAIVETNTRARAPEIVDARSLTEKVDHYFKAKAVVVDDATRARVHQKVAALEGGPDAAA